MPNMKRVYVALGGNIGETEVVFRKALKAIDAMPEVEKLQVSSFYETEPVSAIPQRLFLNAVCSFETTLLPKEVFYAMQQIERDLGRVREVKDAPREIDLDILFYGVETYHDEELTIPHPRWEERSFVTIPLNELLEIESDAQS